MRGTNLANEQESDKEKILAAMGGKRGLLDSGLPTLIFLVGFNFTKDIVSSAFFAILLLIGIVVFRLIWKQPVQYAIAGIFGVVICAWLARSTGNAEDFYLPGLLTNVVYGIAYLFSIIVRFPVIGLVVGPIIGENLQWRKDPARRNLYMKATWLWVGLFALRVMIQYPLYMTGNINALGTARFIMGYPLFIFTAWLTWQIVKNGPKLKEELRRA